MIETIEYPEPNPHDHGHVRAVGYEYLAGYREFFECVQIYKTTNFSDKYRLYIYEDRSMWPTAEIPLRRPMKGEKHIDVVPVCFVKG